MFTEDIINFLTNRVIQLGKAIEESANNHNNIVGRLHEAKELVNLAKSGAENIANAVEQVAKAAAPIVSSEVLDETKNDVKVVEGELI